MPTFNGTTTKLKSIGEKNITCPPPQSKVNIEQNRAHLMCKAINFKSYEKLRKRKFSENEA
jgi:hypothetical protein